MESKNNTLVRADAPGRRAAYILFNRSPSTKSSKTPKFRLGPKARLSILADSDPAVRSRIRHSTGSKNLNVSTGVATDINSWTSSGTGNSTVRTVMLVNKDACTYSDATKTRHDTTGQDKTIQTSNINRYIHQTEIKTYIKHKSIYTLNINQNIH